MADEPEQSAQNRVQNNHGQQIERLRGRANYSDWSFAMQTYLELDDLWGCVLGTESYIADARKMTRARSKIILGIEPINYVHVRGALDAKTVWEKLRAAFEDSGLTRKVGLLRILVTTSLEKCSTVEEYVNRIISTAHKLQGVGFNVGDEWIGTLLLAGLPEEFKPMIMGIESSGTAITADSIKTKLLQDVKIDKVATGESDAALYSRGHQTRRKVGPRCFKCNKNGHIAAQCKSEKKGTDTSDKEKKDTNHKALYALYAPSQLYKDHWYIDSCASSHMTFREDLLESKGESSAQVITADNGTLLAEAVGDVVLPKVKSGGEDLVVKNVLLVPGVAANLLSVSKMTEKGHTVVFDPKGCRVVAQNGETIITAIETSGIYRVDADKQTAFHAKEESGMLWHRRLGHLNRKGLGLLKKGQASGIEFSDKNEEPCVSCVQGKHHREPFRSSEKRADGKLDLVHSDVCGPMEKESLGGSRYFLTLIDDSTRKEDV